MTSRIPRSAAFKNFGAIQANRMGMVDGSCCGDNDHRAEAHLHHQLGLALRQPFLLFKNQGRRGDSRLFDKFILIRTLSFQ